MNLSTITQALVTAAGNTDSILNDLLTSSSIAPRGIDADKDVGSVDADIRSDEEEFAEGYVLKSMLSGFTTLIGFTNITDLFIKQLIARKGQEPRQ